MKNLFRRLDVVIAQKPFILVTIGISLIFLSTNYSSIGSSEEPVIIFAAYALIFTFMQLSRDSLKTNFIDLNYNRAVKKFKVNKNEKPFLKALIKMKSENSDYVLAEIYNISPEMFTKEKLLEKLYE